MSADVIILDIASEVKHFRSVLLDLGILDLTAEDVVKNMIPYLQDEQTMWGSLFEYSNQLGEMFANRLLPEVIEKFVYAVDELGSDIINQLNDIVAFDDVGALWYDFHSFCGDDIVLTRSTLSKPLPRNSS